MATKTSDTELKTFTDSVDFAGYLLAKSLGFTLERYQSLKKEFLERRDDHVVATELEATQALEQDRAVTHEAKLPEVDHEGKVIDRSQSS